MVSEIAEDLNRARFLPHRVMAVDQALVDSAQPAESLAVGPVHEAIPSGCLLTGFCANFLS